MGGVPVNDATHVVVDAEDLLKHDDSWSIAAGRQREIAVELTAVERVYGGHER